ncbi:phosphotransferase [Paenibacillus sp. LHD-117]|uniref:phosphotransferase enzyme family protein n=1 Tax=Paenibacillus sp. LHD-117 TaxID=3071412 RepID=UPI0027E0CD68|nr:phosphotransferase [Paenibacillus sp. LHD-117]MDQ6423532.1 phosphotransferase [Paenibacillus sp. LHD-117]
MLRRWEEEVAGLLKTRFGLTVRDASPIDKGWLNVKWKVETDGGLLFVKYYHPERYKLHARPERKTAIEQTLELQQGLGEAGVPCPRVQAWKGSFIQETPSGMHITLMDWVDGVTVTAGSMNDAQMRGLGQAAGRMHRWLAAVPPLDKPAWQPDQSAYLREWETNREKAAEAKDETVLAWLSRSRAIVGAMDFRQFEASKPGWLHWDLWVDNLLLHDQGVAGIVDFDRMTMAYPEIDVARAVLSGALQDGELRLAGVRAFMDGYREHAEASGELLVRAIRMLYLIESIWWLRTEIRAESELRGLLARFVEEMHWIEDHWQSLPELLERV